MSSYEAMLLAAIENPPDPNELLPLSNRRMTIYGSTLSFLVMSWMAVAVRLWVRFRVVREPGWDDAFIFMAAMCNTAGTVCVCLSVEHGLGHHMLYLGLPNIEQYLLFFYLEHNFYVSESSMIKISLLLQYLRIFKAGPMRWTCIALLGLVSIWGLGFFFVAWFPCFPVRGSWDRTIGAKCYGFGLGDVQSFIALFKIFSASNMAFDLAIFLTPLVLFRTPNLRMKTIVAMVGLFAFGALVVSMSVWRLYGITATRAGTFPYLDFTWLTPPMIIASCLEIDMAIICASMPIFWPMIEKSLAAIFVSYELEIVEERVDDQGLVYEMEHMGGREGSLKSSGTSTQELTNEEDEEGGAVRRVYTVGPDPLNDEARAAGFKAGVRSKPKPKWAL